MSSATLQKRIQNELNALDGPAMAGVLEYLRRLNRPRQDSRQAPPEVPDLDHVLSLTSTSEASWSDAVAAERNDGP